MAPPVERESERNLHRLPGLQELRQRAEFAAGIRIAVIDGGVERSHPAFDGADLAVQASPAGRSAAQPSDHGTHVTSILVGQPESPVVGLVPRASCVAIPVYEQLSQGVLRGCEQIHVAAAVRRALASGAQVINISGGERRSAQTAAPELLEAIEMCGEQGTLVVAATGNDSCACSHVPASLANVLAVGAMDEQGRPMLFSNWGPEVARQGVLAPGSSILGAIRGGRTLSLDGTSFATPMVTGIVAAMLAVQIRRGETPDALKIRQQLLDTAAPCDRNVDADCQKLLRGRIDVESAMSALWPQSTGPSEDHNHILSMTNPSSIALVINPSENAVSTPNESATLAPSEAPAPAVTPSAPLDHSRSPGLQASAVEQSGPPESGSHATQPSVASACACPASPGSPTTPTPVSVGPAPTPIRPSGLARSNTTDPGFPDAETQLIYAIGELSYDFGTQARLDFFSQQLGGDDKIFDKKRMAQFLAGLGEYKERGPSWEQANALIWTLNIDSIPVYAMQPADTFAYLTYQGLVAALIDQESANETIEASRASRRRNEGDDCDACENVQNSTVRITCAGGKSGTTELFNGDVIPVVNNLARGLNVWSTDALLKALYGCDPDEQERTQVSNFFDRIYYTLRNDGTSDGDRAMNYIAVNGHAARTMYQQVLKKKYALDKITVTKSPLCRRNSNCWDVSISFFNPAKRMEDASWVWKQTVDVCDTVPVTVGSPNHWFEYTR